MAYNGERGYLLNWTDFFINAGASSFKNIKGDFNNSVVYSAFQSDENYFYLTYYFFYGYDKKTDWGAMNHNLDTYSSSELNTTIGAYFSSSSFFFDSDIAMSLCT